MASVIKKKGDDEKPIEGFEWRLDLCYKKISLVVGWKKGDQLEDKRYKTGKR